MNISRIPQTLYITFVITVLLSVLFTSYAAAAGEFARNEVEEIISGNSFYVSPTGSPDNDGSIDHPWDLGTALSHPEAVKPGDTIWLRGGTYRGSVISKLQGTQENPIIVRSYPGEWAVIDTGQKNGDPSGFQVYSRYTYYWDFEITNSIIQDRGGANITTQNCYNKFINMQIHDAGGNSFTCGNEIYGSIFYNNGIDGSGLAHQLYVQNDDLSNPMLLNENIIFNSYAFNIHVYSGRSSYLEGIHMRGNVVFNSGVAASDPDYRKDNILVGGVNGTSGILMQENMGWAPATTHRSVSLGKYGDQNQDIQLENNYLYGTTRFYNSWKSIKLNGNMFAELYPNGVDPDQLPDNVCLTERPEGKEIFLRANKYDPNRAHIIIYNWDLEYAVDLDLSEFLSVGETYEIRNAQNYFSDPVRIGKYRGGIISIPVTGLTPALPTAPGSIEPDEYTGREFNVFVLNKNVEFTGYKSYIPIVQK